MLCKFINITKKPLQSNQNLLYYSKPIGKEAMAMKVIHTVPVDIDELIFAGEITVPSDR